MSRPSFDRSGSHLLLTAMLIAGVACTKAEAKTRGVGDSLKPFIIKNSADGRKYCQVCEYGGKAVVMSVFDLQDASLEADLSRIQKLVDAHKEKGLVAFAVVGKMDGDKLASVPDEAKTVADLKAVKERLGITFPVVVLPGQLSESEAKNYAKFNESYETKGSRTVLFSTAANKIAFADKLEDSKAEAQFKALEDTVSRSL